jgi:hypothetical protein
MVVWLVLDICTIFSLDILDIFAIFIHEYLIEGLKQKVVRSIVHHDIFEFFHGRLDLFGDHIFCHLFGVALVLFFVFFQVHASFIFLLIFTVPNHVFQCDQL